MRAGEEVLWDVDERATLFIEPNAALAGAGRVTLVVSGLDAPRAPRCPAHRARADREVLDGVRHVKVPDPDGNAIAFAELPDAASAG